MIHPLIEYIKEARSSGMASEQMVKTLTDAGWKIHDVVDIVLDHATTKETSTLGTSITTEELPQIIQVRDLTKSYGKVIALDHVTLDVEKDGVTALLGPNGAGKTTLIRILTTLLSPTSGKATVANLDVTNDAQTLRSQIGLAGQFAAVDEVLSGRENLEMVARLYHLSAKESKIRAQELLEQFDLVDAANRPVKTYSGGMRRRLDLAASLVIKPKILFLDEPTTGLDPRSRFALWHTIRDLVKDGTTVLLTTQYLEEADNLAKKIFVIDHGRIIAQGTSDELKRNVGGDMVELHIAHHNELEKIAELIKKFGSGEPTIDAETDIVSIPVTGGASVLAGIVRALDEAHIELLDLQLRRPSLDDVFMKLTGHSAQ